VANLAHILEQATNQHEGWEMVVVVVVVVAKCVVNVGKIVG
jgi:hypothetical protein